MRCLPHNYAYREMQEAHKWAGLVLHGSWSILALVGSDDTMSRHGQGLYQSKSGGDGDVSKHDARFLRFIGQYGKILVLNEISLHFGSALESTRPQRRGGRVAQRVRPHTSHLPKCCPSLACPKPVSPSSPMPYYLAPQALKADGPNRSQSKDRDIFAPCLFLVRSSHSNLLLSRVLECQENQAHWSHRSVVILQLAEGFVHLQYTLELPNRSRLSEGM